ncbi:MAG: hypothetical protein BA869_01620 [Desulfuromonadales bacterium C00003107]|jgi:hypothetical protein|nr:MAG: hypothetical protein BA869_01620 [Desulfuromonadales bacterium C00003107]
MKQQKVFVRLVLLAGALSVKSYIQSLAEPGEHLLLARAENGLYVKADLEGGCRESRQGQGQV